MQSWCVQALAARGSHRQKTSLLQSLQLHAKERALGLQTQPSNVWLVPVRKKCCGDFAACVALCETLPFTSTKAMCAPVTPTKGSCAGLKARPWRPWAPCAAWMGLHGQVQPRTMTCDLSANMRTRWSHPSSATSTSRCSSKQLTGRSVDSLNLVVFLLAWLNHVCCHVHAQNAKKATC